MTKPSALRTIVLGTGSNYLRVFVRMFTGIITFRLLFHSLDAQGFGFYQLLWSTIGYTVLLDFGLGISVVRSLAARIDSDDPHAKQESREVVSTVFFAYVGLAFVLMGLVLWGGDRLLHSLTFDSAGAIDRYRTTALIFASVAVFSFPFGVFREALRGQGRPHVCNVIDVCCGLLQTGLIAWACLTHKPLELITLLSVSSSSLAYLIMGVVAMQEPEVRPRLTDFRWSRIRELSGFSIVAYLITMASILSMRVDQLVIGTLVSVQAIAIYTPGSKLMGLFHMLATQMQETLGPVAARLATQKADPSRLRTLFLKSQRWSVMVATLVVTPLLLDLRGAIALLAGELHPSDEMLLTARMLIIAIAAAVIAAECARRILMMAGHHRLLFWFAITESAINFSVSVWLSIRWRSCSGAAAGTLVALSTIAFTVMPVVACRVLDVKLSEFWLVISGRGLVANALAIGVAVVFFHAPVPLAPSARFVVGSLLCGLAALPGWWLHGLLPDERAFVQAQLAGRFSRVAMAGKEAP
ncbi:MAG: oligosaccharide flippase family protein [Deltaproteobacteria bacterium]|nr:oligosaccharide flippase family protein [Deltaproteobacteria bacterium]